MIPHLFGLSIAVMRGRTVFIADTAVNELPEPEQLVEIAMQSAAKARQLGHEPRVGFLSFSTFGQPLRARRTHPRGRDPDGSPSG
jgi:malate dehydrogenase (oxaloacetate-decarboxylating)(NADP+)